MCSKQALSILHSEFVECLEPSNLYRWLTNKVFCSFTFIHLGGSDVDNFREFISCSLFGTLYLEFHSIFLFWLRLLKPGVIRVDTQELKTWNRSWNTVKLTTAMPIVRLLKEAIVLQPVKRSRKKFQSILHLTILSSHRKCFWQLTYQQKYYSIKFHSVQHFYLSLHSIKVSPNFNK